ncbi:MAG TPA: hypothetical protein VLA16_18710, partial [Ideonella sp.]|nr:hypothetical protein [Ideonella sp.]
MAGSALAAASGVVTIVDVESGQAGQATVLRGVARFQLAEGVPLREDDIVEAGAQARLLRLEFGDGLSVSVGPASRVWIAPRLPGERGKAAPRFYLLQGWAKVDAPADGMPRSAFATPAFDAAGAIRAVVVAVSPEGAQVFAEAGEVRLQVPGAGGSSTASTLKAGELWSRSGETKAVLAPRPTPAFIQRVPKAFLDTLPARAALFKARE